MVVDMETRLSTIAAVRFLSDVPSRDRGRLALEMDIHQGFVFIYEVYSHHQRLFRAVSQVLFFLKSYSTLISRDRAATAWHHHKYVLPGHTRQQL